MLNSLLYRGAFPKKNRPGTTFGIYRKIFSRLFQTILARKSFFLQMVFFGELRFPEGFPVECDPNVFAAAQRSARACKIDFVLGDVLQYVRQSRGVGFVSLSDVPSFLPRQMERTFLATMRPGLAARALIATRGHLRLVEPDLGDFRVVSDQFQDAISRETTQLWKVDVYERAPMDVAERGRSQQCTRPS
jgi:S-adenosylmethionine-diacylglycerol 3-amino-3-carboxypropyl transferase